MAANRLNRDPRFTNKTMILGLKYRVEKCTLLEGTKLFLPVISGEEYLVNIFGGKVKIHRSQFRKIMLAKGGSVRTGIVNKMTNIAFQPGTVCTIPMHAKVYSTGERTQNGDLQVEYHGVQIPVSVDHLPFFYDLDNA